jgi:hypothetical protein
VNFGFGSVCDLRCEKECCFFWFPLMTQFSWPAECGHGIEHVICVQVSLGFFFFFFGFLYVSFLFVWFFFRAWDPACLFLVLSVSIFAF